MAQNLQSLKKRIKTAQNISQIARAMEMIAASKIKKAQAAALNSKPYSDKITEVLGRMLSAARPEDTEHPFMIKNEGVTRDLVVAFSPDKGLAGSLVTNLSKKMLAFEPSKHTAITVGRKIEKFASKVDYDVHASFPFGTKFPAFAAVYPLMKLIGELYLQKKVAQVHVVYTEFRTMFSLGPSTFKLLPVEPQAHAEGAPHELPYKFEPDTKYILNELIPYYLEIKLYNALIQSYTSEQAARMVAMGSAKDNALDITDSLTLVYNKTRQERITNEILDISNAKLSQ